MLKSVIGEVLLIALAVNALSHTVAQCKWAWADENGAELVPAAWSNPDSEITVYRIAGCGNQPEQAFKFIESDLANYYVVDVNYRPNRGCNMNLIAQQVCDDIEKHHYQKVLIVGCSIGDYVGRVCEAKYRNVYTIAINPEPDSSLLQPWAKVATRAGVPLARVVGLFLGWGMQWQAYSDCGNHFSLNFMVSQFGQIGYCHGAPRCTDNMLGMVLAEADANSKGADEFLLGRDAMEAYFGPDVPIYSAVGVGHGNTVKGADAYKTAWDQLWPQAKARLEGK